MELESFLKHFDFKDLNFATNSLLTAIGACLIFVLVREVKKWRENKRKRPPGPTGLPFVGYLPFLGKEPHKAFWDLKKKYGDVFSIYLGPKYTVVLNEYNVTKEVLSNPSALDRAPELFSHLGNIGFITESGEKWVEQRRYCLSATRDLGLGKNHWEDLIMEEIFSFVEKLENLKGNPADISHDLACSLTSNIISLLIGRRLRKDESDKVQLSVDYSDVAFTYMGPSNPTSVVPGLRKVCEVLKLAGYDKALDVIRRFSAFVREEIALHKTSPVSQDAKDFINSYLRKLSELTETNSKNHYFSEEIALHKTSPVSQDAKDFINSYLRKLSELTETNSKNHYFSEEIALHKTSPVSQDAKDFINSYLRKLSELTETNSKNHYFSEVMLEGNLSILFLGASDTIFSSLGWLFRLMCKHKDIQDKVYAEIMEVLGKDGYARYDERHKVPYTFAVIMEGQRFASNVPLSTTRKASQDIHVNGYVIPKGSEIFANLWALHYDPAYWENPEEYRPERFLTDGGTKLVKHPPSFAPFSVGRRNCPGETIAWMEILFYFTETIKRFEISTPPGVEPEFDIVNGLVSRLSPQALCFKERGTSK